MASLPYIATPGNIDKALAGIKSAAVPERVSQDFVKTILKIPGGSGDQMTSYLKKLGLANSDGSPNDLYRKFRNPTSSGAAIAQAIRAAYAPLYVRNEYMHELTDAQLKGLIVEETGQPHASSQVKLIHSCIKHLKELADFETEASNEQQAVVEKIVNPNEIASREAPIPRGIGLNLGYTINLNLPASTDPAVFDAIFKAIKEHLLREDDA